jgi:hypothetical protein
MDGALLALHGRGKASHPVRHRYIISRAPCPSDKELIFTSVSADRVQPPYCTIYTNKMSLPVPETTMMSLVVWPEHEPNMTLFITSTSFDITCTRGCVCRLERASSIAQVLGPPSARYP